MVKWTEEQEEAIYSSGQDILVAAAAGSGKTAVLVERMIQKLLNPQNQVDIDKLLVVTFTNAAAQEMRNRVGEALEKALNENPNSMHLKKQLSLLQKAPISTLHSFCLDVVKQYAYILDIDPGFRIADVMEADLIKQDVMDDLLEKWYGGEEGDQEAFFSVVDRFSSDRSDAAVESLILDLYQFASTNPSPKHWLDHLVSVYEIPETIEETDITWLHDVKADIKLTFEAIYHEVHTAMEIARESDGPYQYIETLEMDADQVNKAIELVEDWNQIQEFMNTQKFARLSGKKTECNEDKKAEVKAIRDDYKKEWEKLQKKWFTRSLKAHLQDMRELAPVIRQLVELVKQFMDAYLLAKKEKALVDFSDLEHFCLQILQDETSTPDCIQPSDIAKQFKSQFHEVLIDEYQDTNLVQESILSLVRDDTDSGNLFMVGDVKQSIYRFRHAEPSLFLNKYKAYGYSDQAGQRIDLARNFRSREDVLIGTNYIFRQILDEALGEMTYDRSAELIYANKTYDQMPYPQKEPELLVIDREDVETTDEHDDEFAGLEKAQIEARAYVQKIKSWIGTEGTQPLQVGDKSTGVQRDIQYRDIVILQRSMTWASIIVDELKKEGIPVYAELSTGYFEAIEVKIMLSMLKIIDNPRQDIPLASVLKSSIVGLDEEELARVRLENQQDTYYEALIRYEKNNEDQTSKKISRFLELFSRFRLVARQGALSELIWTIYRETGFYDFVGGMPGGRQRTANLRALYDRARSYEKTSFRGLFRFLRFIERMEERGDDLGSARALSEQEDVVRVMTIHKSKGLEFPVVLLGGMDKQFNMQDLMRKYSLHKDMGFGTKYIDPIKRIMYPTLFHVALNEKKKKEMLAEEMRVLYVALTRAKEKLVMVGNVASFEKRRQQWSKILNHEQWVLPAHFRGNAHSYLDWVAPSLMRHQDNAVLRPEGVMMAANEAIQRDPSSWQVDVISVGALLKKESDIQSQDRKILDHVETWEPLDLEKNEEIEADVANRLEFTYQHQEATSYRAKQSVTEIKRQGEKQDEYASVQLLNRFVSPIRKRPQFMQEDTQVTAAEKGTALHTVMQHIPLNTSKTAAEIEEFVATLVHKEILDEVFTDVIDYSAIEAFYQTDIAKYMMHQEKIYKEVPFNLSLDAKEVYQEWTSEQDENIFVQGIIDVIFKETAGWVILDYKTDRITEEMTDEVYDKLKKRYQIQLSLYKRAIEDIWQEPVTKAYLYFFDKSLLVEVDL